MRKTIAALGCLMILALAFSASAEPRYVEMNGTSYYDANDIMTDTLPSGPYTKNGQYLINPDEATNTRDNRGLRPMGYGHNVNDDPRPVQATTVVYPDGQTTTIYQNTNTSYPARTTIYRDTTVYPDQGPTVIRTEQY